MPRCIMVLWFSIFVITMQTSFAGDSFELKMKTPINKNPPPNVPITRNYLPSRVTTINLVNHGTLTFTLPENWILNVKEKGGWLPPSLEIKPVSGNDFLILISPLWVKNTTGSFTLPEMKKLADSSAKSLAATSEEGTYNLTRLDGQHLQGYYYQLTDKTPRPDEWKNLLQGMLFHGNIYFFFSIFTHSKDAPEVTQGLTLMKNMTHQ